ncbi:MAG: hypothetical protein LBI12_05960, partial [Treponema sp.]|nr:hypothetical protein [Treponema sp.]
KYFSNIGSITPRNFRIGGGREEPDGAVSFLVRFLGRDYGITGELYIRYVTRLIQEDDGEMAQSGNWVVEELILEEAKRRDSERQEALRFIDFMPYERFF